MKKPHFAMLPEKAFQPRNGRMAFAGGGMTLEGCCGPAPAPQQSAPTQTTVQNTNIPCYAKPYVQTMLGATTQQLFNTTGSGCCIQITGVKPYVPYSTNPADYVAGFSPLQQRAQQGVANLTQPGQYGQASNMAGAAGLGALGTTGQAARYGMMGNMAGQQGSQLSNMYGGAGAIQGQQGAAIGQSLGQQSTNPYAVGAYMNPYIQNTLNPALQLLNQQYGQQAAQEQGQATGAGAFGGSREALMSGLNQQNQMLAQNQLVGNAYNTAYTNAQNQMNTANQAALAGNQQALSGYGMGLQGAGQAGNLGISGAQAGLAGVGAQQAGYGQAGQAGATLSNIGGQCLSAQQSILNAQATAGAQQQQNQQQIINNAINNYAVAQQYPQQQLAFMNAQLRGLPLQSSTVQQYQAAPSAVSQAAGLGTAGIAGLGLYNTMAGKAKGGIV
jgi:hypothetical protein